MIKIEVLYAEVCNFFGDTFNIKYLSKFDGIEIIYTSLNEVPKFTKEKIDMIYLSPMTEKTQELVIKKLYPYKDKIKELIDNGVVFFLSGNAMEVFGKYIENENKTRIKGLGLTPLYAKRDMMHRYNTPVLAKFENINIVGFKSSFSSSYGENETCYLFKVKKGFGINKDSKYEGIRINNLFGTYILGPLFIENPLFTKYILNLLGLKPKKLVFEEDIMDCYGDRLKEFEKLKIK